VDPLEAARHYNLTRAQFEEDQSFTAIADDNGRPVTSRGTYTYNSWTRELKLRTGARELTYSALVWWGNELHMKKIMDDGRQASAVLFRTDDCIRCAGCPTCSRE
jgi:hypothetical protein